MAIRIKHSTHLKRLSKDATASVTTATSLSLAASTIDNLTLRERCDRDEALLRTRSPEAQQYRRALLRGRRFLIVEDGVPGKAFIYGRLRELGVHVTILDSDTTIWKKHADLDEFISYEPLGDGGEDGAVSRALASIAGLSFDAVTTYWEDAIFVASRVGEELGIATNPASACAQSRNKLRTRSAMAKAGLPVPRFTRIDAACDIAEAAKVVGFPAVLKPASGAASLGVVRVDSSRIYSIVASNALCRIVVSFKWCDKVARQ